MSGKKPGRSCVRSVQDQLSDIRIRQALQTAEFFWFNGSVIGGSASLTDGQDRDHVVIPVSFQAAVPRRLNIIRIRTDHSDRIDTGFIGEKQDFRTFIVPFEIIKPSGEITS